MDTFWTLLILIIVVILLFMVLPSFVETPTQTYVLPIKAKEVPIEEKIKQDRANTKKKDQEMLNSFYTPARDKVPVDNPLKPVGSCPMSKPLSTDLPLIDVPMCLVSKDNYNMHLSK